MLNAVEYLESLGFETVEVKETKSMKYYGGMFVLGSAVIGALLAASVATPVILYYALFQ